MRVREGTVDRVMAVGTASHKGLGFVDGTGLRDTMAIDTGSGLIREQQVVRGGTVRNMTEAAVFSDRSVLEHERAALSLVALGALLGLEVQAGPAGLVRPMAVRASEHALPHGVVGGQVQLGTHVRMASDTQAGRDVRIREQVTRHVRICANVEGLVVVGGMTVCAEQPRLLMIGGLPAEQTAMACRVAIEADFVGGVSD